MDDRKFVHMLELKLNSYRTRVRDLEIQVSILNKTLKEKESQSKIEKASEQNKNNS